jgi:hypothetical protein
MLGFHLERTTVHRHLLYTGHINSPGLDLKWLLIGLDPIPHRTPFCHTDDMILTEEDVESTQGAKRICNPIGGTTIWTYQCPGALDSSFICIKRWPNWSSLEREAHWSYKHFMSQYRGTPGPRSGSGWVGEWGSVWGNFRIALEM